MSPHQTRTYSLTISGDLDNDFLSAHCPAGATLMQCGNCTRLENLHTDQAGILGIFRVLHNLGLTILEMNIFGERISQ
jgi:hypothetical protein